MFNLPNDVLIYIVGTWLDFEAFGNLDIAISNKIVRTIFLQLIQSHEFVYYGSTLNIHGPYLKVVDWLTERRIKVGKVSSVSCVEFFDYVGLQLHRLDSLSWTPNVSKEEDCMSVLNQCTSLSGLTISHINTFAGLTWPFGPKLYELYLNESFITSADILAIGDNCVNLRKLTLMNCLCNEINVYPIDNNHFTQLEMLCTRNIPINTVEYLIHKTTKLGLIGIDRDVSLLLAKYCKTLTSLTLDWFNVVDVEVDFSEFLKQSPQLETLQVMGYSTYKVSPKCLEALADTCVNIVSLELQCDESNLALFGRFLSRATKLKSISMHSEGVLECAIQHCCPSVEDIEILTSSAQLNRIPGVFPNLKSILVEDECPCNDLVVNLAQYCPKLESVHLFTAVDIIDESAIALVQNCPMLTFFNIQSAHTTDKLVAAIVKYGNNLTELSLCGDKLTAAAYLALCEGCPLLKKITFDACHDLPYDVSVHEAIKKLKTVRKVDLLDAYVLFDEEFGIEVSSDREDDSDLDSEEDLSEFQEESDVEM